MKNLWYVQFKALNPPPPPEQGGTNFTPFVLSLQYTKKNLRKKYFPIWMEVSFEALVWLGYFFLQKLEKICIWEFQSWSSGVNTLGLSPLSRYWHQINFKLQCLLNFHKKYIFAKINLFSRELSLQNFDFLS